MSRYGLDRQVKLMRQAFLTQTGGLIKEGFTSVILLLLPVVMLLLVLGWLAYISKATKFVDLLVSGLGLTISIKTSRELESEREGKE